MTEPLNLTQLRSFLSVVEHGGFARAARALHISQSTVSQHIRALESRLATTLLDRDTGNPTPAGEQVLRDAHTLFSAHDRLLAGFDTADRRPEIGIGSTEHAADQLIPHLVAILRDTYPRHDVTFTFDRSLALIAAVGRGALDIAITLATEPDAPGTHVGDLDLRWAVDARHQHRAVAPSPEPTPLVVFDNPCGIRARAIDRLVDSGHRPHVAAQAATLDGVLSAVRSGLGIALLPIISRLPDGLTELSAMPDAGRVGVHVVNRPGLDRRIAETAEATVASLLHQLRRGIPAVAPVSALGEQKPSPAEVYGTTSAFVADHAIR